MKCNIYAQKMLSLFHAIFAAGVHTIVFHDKKYYDKHKKRNKE